jgi:hypothetical protein
MAVTLQSYNRATVRVDGVTYSVGSLETPISITVTNEIVFQRVYSIATGANATVYDDTLSNFDFLWIASDFNSRLLCTNVNSVALNFQLLGTGTSGSYGVPFILGLDLSTNSSVTVNTFQVFNDSGSTANILVLALD